jgi:hypothetical protein
MTYRRRQPRTPYKDWGEMFEAEGWNQFKTTVLKSWASSRMNRLLIPKHKKRSWKKCKTYSQER